VIALALFGLLAEVALRLYLVQRIVYDVEMVRYAQLLKVDAENPRIGHVHRPGAEARLMGVDVRISSDGLRDDEHDREPGERHRIVILGDSLTFGWGVEEDETFATILERELSKERPTEIVNLGTGNYGTVQEVELFLEKGRGYRPEQLVVFWFINDAEPVPAKARWAFLAHSRAVTLYWSRLRRLFAGISPERSFREYYAGLYADDQPGWREAQAAFLRLAETCREDGIRLQVVLLPELHELASYPFEREHALVAGFLRENGIETLDLAPAFAEETDPRSLWVAPDDAHPNARAHRRIAEASRDFLGTEAGAGSP